MLRIIQITDTHLAAGHPAFDANFDAAAAHVRAVAPDLVVHTGDICRDAPGAPQELAHAAARLAGLGTELLCLPGNHDIGDNPGDGGYTPKQPVTADLIAAWTAQFGPDRWVLDRGGWRLVGLNSLLFLSDLPAEAEQWDWLSEALAVTGPIALFLHKPLMLTPEDTPSDPPYRYVPEAPRARLVDLVATHNVRLVACGHVHQTRSHSLGRATCVWGPATAFVLSDAMQPRLGDKVCGVVEYRLSPDGSVVFDVTRPLGIVDQALGDLPKAYP